MPALLTLLAIALPACRSLDRLNPFTDTQRPLISQDELTARLRGFCLSTKTVVARASRHVFTRTEDPEIRRHTMAMRAAVADSTYRVLVSYPPLTALVEYWSLALRSQILMASTEAEQTFGEGQPILEQAFAEITASIERIAAEVFPEKALVEVRAEVEAFARENAVGSLRDGAPAFNPELSVANDADVATWLNPTRFLAFATGVDETARAINAVAHVTDNAAFIVSELPRDTRWQVEMLLEDAPNAEVVARALTDLRSLTTTAEQVAGTAQQLSATADALPQRVREEIVRTLDEVEAKQAGLRETLGEVRLVSEQIDATLETATAMFAAVQQTARALEATGKAWQPTVHEVRALVEGDPDAPPPPPPPPDAEPAEPFEILDYAQTAEAVTATAGELRALVGELRGMLGSDEVPATIGSVEERARATIDHTTTRATDLTDHLFWRTLQLLGVVFALAVAYRWAAGRLAVRSGTP